VADVVVAGSADLLTREDERTGSVAEKKIIDRTQINGVEVISTEPARGIVIPGQPERIVSTVERVLLADGNEWFRCKMNPDECDYYKEDLKPILAHQRTHSPALTAKKATAELAKEKAKRDAEFKRRSNGMKTANEEKQRRYETEVTSTDKRVAAIQRRFSDMAVGIKKITDELSRVAESMRQVNEELGKITPEADVDPAILEKAAAYDVLKGILNK
jgi:hypothetical protein